MKLYKIINPAKQVIDWVGTQADAKAAAKGVNVTWVEEEVPTDKPGLLAWLKANATAKLGE